MLIAEEIAIVKTMPEEQQEYVLARYSEPIYTLTDQALWEKCLQFVEDAVKCNLTAKIVNDKEVIKNLTVMLTKDLRRPKFKSWGISEIELASYKGVRKMFGDFFAVNITAFHSWFDAYHKSKERNEALNAYHILSKEVEAKTSEKPKVLTLEESKKGCVEYFNSYKESGKLGFFPFAYYDIIKKHTGLKTLVQDPEVRKWIKKTSEDDFESKLLKEKDKSYKRGNLSEAEAIMEHLVSGFEGNRFIEHRQKELCLKHFFDQLIKENKDLDSLLSKGEGQ